MVIENNDIKCPECGRFIRKLASMCPYCGAKTVVFPEKAGIICRNCGKKILPKNIRSNKSDNVSYTSHCPYCGVKI